MNHAGSESIIEPSATILLVLSGHVWMAHVKYVNVLISTEAATLEVDPAQLPQLLHPLHIICVGSHRMEETLSSGSYWCYCWNLVSIVWPKVSGCCREEMGRKKITLPLSDLKSFTVSILNATVLRCECEIHFAAMNLIQWLPGHSLTRNRLALDIVWLYTFWKCIQTMYSNNFTSVCVVSQAYVLIELIADWFKSWLALTDLGLFLHTFQSLTRPCHVHRSGTSFSQMRVEIIWGSFTQILCTHFTPIGMASTVFLQSPHNNRGSELSNAFLGVPKSTRTFFGRTWRGSGVWAGSTERHKRMLWETWAKTMSFFGTANSILRPREFDR